MLNLRNRRRVKTTEAVIKVDAGLPAGRYIIRLTVIDEHGNHSKPAHTRLKITRSSDLRIDRSSYSKSKTN